MAFLNGKQLLNVNYMGGTTPETLIDTTLTAEQVGASEIYIEIPNWEKFKTATQILLSVNIVAQGEIASQTFECSLANNGGGAYSTVFSWNTVSCKDGEQLYMRAVATLFKEENGVRDVLTLYSPPNKNYGANSVSNATRCVSKMQFADHELNAPYLRLYLRSGGIFAEGTKIYMGAL